SSSKYGCFIFFFSSRRRHTRFSRDWSSDVCSSDLVIFRLNRFCFFQPIVIGFFLKLFLLCLKPIDWYHIISLYNPMLQQLVLCQIGRASCRERVLISVVSVSFLNKT